MKFKIVAESKGRIRIQILQNRLTIHQADVLENRLQRLDCVIKATVHELTCCAIITYKGPRKLLIDQIKAVTWDFNCTETQEIISSRGMNRHYQEQLAVMFIKKAVRTFILPKSLGQIYVLYRSVPFIWRGIKSLLSRNLKVELLDALSIIISLLRRDFSTTGSVMFLLRIGELLEEWTRKKSVDDLARCMSLNIDRVWKVAENNQDILLPASQIKSGDKIRVHMGGIIPLDGIIDSGEVMVNQASLTGEAVPVPKYPGTTVYAGTVVEEGECIISVTQQEEGSRYDKIVAMIEQTEKLKSTAENKASNLADKLVPYTLLVSGLTYLLTGNPLRAASVLMVDFSCALKLSMPLAVLSAMREAGNHHITVKGGKYLEAVANANTIVFDKTGTITHACPTVKEIIAFGNNDPDEMLRLAACLEEHFPHSMANAVVNAARQKGLLHEEIHSQVEYLVAHGIASTVDGVRVIIGSYHFVFEDENCTVPENEKDKFESISPQYSHLYMCVGNQLSAVICIEDPLREETSSVINTLRKLGIERAVMLTGDSYRTAAAVATQVGIDEYLSEVLPEDKAKYIEKLRDDGNTVIMLGDGINDSPALSMANVGIAISDGAAIAREIADITISADSLFEIVSLRLLSQLLMKRIKMNYRFVMGFNGCLIGLGALGILSPATSALLHNASTLGISLRSMTKLLDESVD